MRGKPVKGGRSSDEPGDGGIGCLVIIMLIASFLIGQFYILPFVREHERKPTFETKDLTK